MFITKQILNEKHRKLMRPHKRQILNQIKASMDDQSWEISRQMSFMDEHQIKSKNKITRPKTAQSTSQSISQSIHRPKSNSINRYSNAQDIQKRSSSFMKKVNYQFKQIKQITSLFDNFFKIKKKKIQPQKIKFSSNVKLIKDKILKKEKQQIQNFEKIKREKFSKLNSNSANRYLGYPKQKIKKVIPVSKAKNQDVNMIATCIKGGYFQETKQYSDLVNKEELIKLKKNFITMATLYDSVKGRKNKGINEIKPQTIDRSSMKNMVYFLENEKHLKFSEKIAIQERIKLIS